VGAITLSRATLRKMHQNLWWAVGYNVVAFPLAAGVLNPFLLGPAVAALAMSGSTAVVAVNALLLKRTKLAGIRNPTAGKPAAAADGAATAPAGAGRSAAETPPKDGAPATEEPASTPAAAAPSQAVPGPAPASAKAASPATAPEVPAVSEVAAPSAPSAAQAPPAAAA
jgi:hypothetical protein